MPRRDSNYHFYEHFFNLSLDPMGVAGFDGYLQRINPAFEFTFGYASDELLARPFYDFVHPDDVQQVHLVLEEVLERGIDSLSFEVRVMHQNGSVLDTIWSAKPLPEMGVVYTVGRDITELKQAEEARAEFDRAASHQQQALELHDKVLRQLVIAKMALEVGEREKSERAIEQTLASVRHIIGESLRLMARYRPLSPGDLRPESDDAEACNGH